jgi:hypothetical protein
MSPYPYTAERTMSQTEFQNEVEAARKGLEKEVEAIRQELRKELEAIRQELDRKRETALMKKAKALLRELEGSLQTKTCD